MACRNGLSGIDMVERLAERGNARLVGAGTKGYYSALAKARDLPPGTYKIWTSTNEIATVTVSFKGFTKVIKLTEAHPWLDPLGAIFAMIVEGIVKNKELLNKIKSFLEKTAKEVKPIIDKLIALGEAIDNIQDKTEEEIRLAIGQFAEAIMGHEALEGIIGVYNNIKDKIGGMFGGYRQMTPEEREKYEREKEAYRKIEKYFEDYFKNYDYDPDDMVEVIKEDMIKDMGDILPEEEIESWTDILYDEWRYHNDPNYVRIL